MSEKKTRIKNIVTSVILIITLLISATTAYAEAYRIGYYISSNGEYVLSSVEGSMTAFDLEWLQDADKFTSIETGAFSQCTSLTTISIPENYYLIKEYAVGYIVSDGTYKKVAGFTIKGKTNSAAYVYAMDNGFEFISTGTAENNTAHTIIPDSDGYVHSGLKNLPKLTKEQIAHLIDLQPISNPYDNYTSAPSVTAPYSLGQVRDEIIFAGLERLNDYRRLAGLTDVSLNDEYSAYAQAASVVNAANNYMTHCPACPADMDAALYENGYHGASHSNLVHYSGYDTPHGSLAYSVDLWMDDSDNANITALGHRRWFLNPSMSQTGFGCATNSYNIHTSAYAMDERQAVGDYDFISWPASGYMPSDTEFFTKGCAWSITINPSKMNTWDYSNVTVTLTRESDGKEWKFNNVNNNQDGFFTVNNTAYGISNCIIFRPDDINDYEGLFTVTVNGLEDLYNKETSISYQVEFFETEDVRPEEITTETTTHITTTTEPTTESTTAVTTTELTTVTTTAVTTTVPTTESATEPTTIPTTVPTTIPTTAQTTVPTTETTTESTTAETTTIQPDSSESTTETTTKAEPLQGDINGDGKITAADARLALRASSKLMTLTDEQLLLSDMNGDSKLNAADARTILRIASRLEVYTKPEKTTFSTTSDTESEATELKSNYDIVYITPTGEKYHKITCRTLQKSTTKINRSAAIEQGYDSCKVCFDQNLKHSRTLTGVLLIAKKTVILFAVSGAINNKTNRVERDALDNNRQTDKLLFFLLTYRKKNHIIVTLILICSEEQKSSQSFQRAVGWCKAVTECRCAGSEQGCDEQSVRRALNGKEWCVMHNSGGTVGFSHPDLS